MPSACAGYIDPCPGAPHDRAVEHMLVKETLPLPYVSYSETFTSFHQDLGSPPFFCECMREAIDAYLEVDAAHASEVRARGLNPWRHYRFNDLPAFFALAARLLSGPPSTFLRENLRFAPQLCHRCNKMPVYAPVFNTSGRHEAVYDFGPYISQRRFECGVDRFGAIAAPLRCPERLIDLTPAVRLKRINQEARQEFGFPRPGINNTQETLLALVVQRLFPKSKVQRRYRSPWMARLEIDVMIEDLRLAFEFQGAQHQQPMEHLGGEAAFEKLQARDARKAKLCAQNGYTLISIFEGEVTPLEDSVRRALMLSKVPHKPAPALEPIRPPWAFEICSRSWNGRWTNHEKANHRRRGSRLRAGATPVLASSRDDVTKDRNAVLRARSIARRSVSARSVKSF